MGSYFRDFYSPKASQRPTVGDTKFSITSQDHMGWLACDGRSLSVSDYNLLFQTVGYEFGGSGNQFTLPDMRGRVPGAIGTGTGLTARALADAVGTETHTLTINEMPAHKHGSVDVSGNTNGDGITDLSGAHTHSGTTDAAGYAASSTSAQTPITGTDVADNTGNHTHTFTTGQPSVLHHHKIGSTGGGAAHNNMQPTLFVGNMFIYSGRPRVGSYPYTSTYPAAIGGTVL
jgi:microcystin-dependent protein